MEFSIDHINESKSSEITEEVTTSFKTKPVTDPGNKAIFFVNNEPKKIKLDRKINFSANLLPKGLLKTGKKEEDLMRPKAIKDTVSIERDEERIIFELKNTTQGKKKKRRR